jgi:DHA3 family tetracycline resistance protein-like MFS transporter
MRTLPAYRVWLLLSGADATFRNTMYVLLPAYYVLVVQMNPLQLVLVGTALEASYFAFQIPTGVLADMFSRKTAVVAGLCLVGLCFVVEGLVPLFGAIVLAEIVRGIGEALFDGADRAWLADELGQEGFPMAIVRGMQLGRIGAIAGTVGAVVLGSIHLNLPVVAGGLSTIGLGGFLLIVMPERQFTPASHTAPRGAAFKATFKTGIRTVAAQPVILGILSAELFAGAASEGFDRLWEAHLLLDVGLPSLAHLRPIAWFGVIEIGLSVVALAASQVLARYVHAATRTSRLSAALLCVLLVAYAVTIVGFAAAGAFAVAVLWLSGKTAVGTVMEAIQAIWLNQSVTDSRVRATVLSMRGSANAIGQVVGGPPIGVVGNVVSLRAAIGATGLILAPMLAIYGWLVQRSGPRAVRAEADATESTPTSR